MNVTRLLERARDGDRAAVDALIEAVYDELRRLARSHLRRERSGQTLSATALVHEAWVTLADQQQPWQGRAHLFGAASRAMRRIFRGLLTDAAAMARAATAHHGDPDVQTFYVDAVMNTMPWDYWQKDGSPKPETARVLETLEAVIAAHPRHPGAHHYYIHAVEASNDPDRAIKSADVLGSLMPAAGHMVHLPAHIYLRVGRYADAAEANVRAIAADEDYLAQCQAQGLYPFTYYPHNMHFLWAAATLEGRKAAAVEAARQVAEKVPHHHAGALAWTADFPVTPWLAYVRFGMWTEMLTGPPPPATDPYATRIRHYGRGVALRNAPCPQSARDFISGPGRICAGT